MKRALAMTLAAVMVAGSTPAYAAETGQKVMAKPMWQEIVLDGYETVMPCYNINGNTYFRLRDMAELVTDHGRGISNFDVSYDTEKKMVGIDRMAQYTGERRGNDYSFDLKEKQAVLKRQEILLGGAYVKGWFWETYVIDGYTYFKLRELMELVSVDVNWCEAERVIELQSDHLDWNDGFRKPVIYLYPEETTDVSVEVDLDGKFTVTYPSYNDGWNVSAQPDGTLTNKADGREYSYLFWEGEGYGNMDFSEGFCVKGEDTAAFLQDKLAAMGMTPKEYNEFIVYWLPYMQDNPYNLISFQWENYEEAAKLNITPEPDNMLRVFMAFKSMEQPVEVPEQKLPTLEREGFTVVEWGGTEVR